VARDVTVWFGDHLVLDEVGLVVASRDRIGLVAPNGTGKSTLLRVLVGHHTPDRGTVALAPPSGTVGYLPQQPERRPGETVREFLARRTGVTATQAELHRAAAAVAEATQASTFCLPKDEASDSAARPRSKFSRTASEEAEVTDSKASVADFAARAVLAAAMVALLLCGREGPIVPDRQTLPATLQAICYAAGAKSTIYAALHHAAGCGLFAAPPLAVQMPFMVISGPSIQVTARNEGRNQLLKRSLNLN
jgi:hypothetical protein